MKLSTFLNHQVWCYPLFRQNPDVRNFGERFFGQHLAVS